MKNDIIKTTSGVKMRKLTPLILLASLIVAILIPFAGLAAPSVTYQRELYPELDNTYRLGSSTVPLRWKEANVVNLNVTGTCTGCGSGSLSDWVQQSHFTTQVLTPSTTIPVWLKDVLYSSSTIFQSTTTQNYNASTFVAQRENIIAQATVNGTYNVFGAQNSVNALISAGVTNNGSLTGNDFLAARTSSSDLGTLAALRGFFSEVGHVLPGASAATTNVYGLLVNSHAGAGTISNMYGIRLDAITSGGTLLASYGAYLDPLVGSATTTGLLSNKGDNYFNYGLGNYNFNVRSNGNKDALWVLGSNGNVGIGTSSPYAKLSVVGETVASHFTATTTSTSTLPNTQINRLGLGTVGPLNETYTSLAGVGLTNNGISLDCDTANTSTQGCITNTDWNTFNNKIASTSLSGASVISYTPLSGVITTTPGTFGGSTAYTFPQDLVITGSATTSNLRVTNVASTTAFYAIGATTTNFYTINASTTNLVTGGATSTSQRVSTVSSTTILAADRVILQPIPMEGTATTSNQLYHEQNQATLTSYFSDTPLALRYNSTFFTTSTSSWPILSAGGVEGSLVGTSTSPIGTTTIPANFLIPGRKIVVSGFGVYTTQVSALTLRVRVYIDGTVVCDTGANATTNSLTGLGWTLNCEIAVQKSGVAGELLAGGRFVANTSATDSTHMPEFNNNTVMAINTTVSHDIRVTAAWQSAVAVYNIIGQSITYEIKN